MSEFRFVGGAVFSGGIAITRPFAVLTFDETAAAISIRPRVFRAQMRPFIADAPRDPKLPIWASEWSAMHSVEFDRSSIFFRMKNGRSVKFWGLGSQPVTDIVHELYSAPVPIEYVERVPRIF